MKRKHLFKYESLAYLLKGHTSGTNLDTRARRGSYWRNTVKVQIRGGIGNGLLLTRDGYFVTNYHVLTDQRARNGSTIILPDTEYQFLVSRVLAKSKLHDLVLAQASLGEASVLTEVVLSNHQPSFPDRVRVYGYKHEVVEEKQGNICKSGPSYFGKSVWQAMGIHRINPGWKG